MVKLISFCVKHRLAIVRAVIILAFVAFVGLCVYVYFGNPIKNSLFPCGIKRRTGISCPSCGITRWLYSMLKFNFKDAFYYHAFLTVAFPLIAYILASFAVNLFVDKKIIPYIPHGLAVYIVCIVGFAVFAIARNFIPGIL